MMSRKTAGDMPLSAEQLLELFARAPGFMVYLRGPDHVFEWTNEAYRHLVGDRNLIGRPVREALPELLQQGRIELLQRVFETAESFVGERMSLKLRRQPEGPLEEHFVDFVYHPIKEADGTVSGIFVQGSEVTNSVRAERKILFQAKLLDVVQEAVIATDLAGSVVYWNRFAESLYGWSAEEVLGRSILDLNVSPPARGDAKAIMTRLQAGETWSGEMVLQRRDGTRFPAHVSDAPVHDEAGELVGIVGISFDISERKRAEENQSLLVRELHHRVKNTLATVQAIMNSTARSAETIAEFRYAFTGRIDSMAKTHALLADDKREAVLFEELLRTELSPYDDEGGERVILEGPRIMLPSEMAVPIGMAIHELTTNAAKYGALADLSGSVAVRWRLIEGESGRTLRWVWSEHDGPPVSPPSREGFGSRLLKRVLATQIRADVAVDFRPEGLRVDVTVPFGDHSAKNGTVKVNHGSKAHTVEDLTP